MKPSLQRFIPLVLSMFLFPSCVEGKTPGKEPDTTFVRYTADVSYYSNILDRSMNYGIILPEDYVDSDREYPVVYLLHGYGDDNHAWNDQWLGVETKIEELEAEGLEPMIYILPTGFNSYYCNRYDGSFDYMDMFVQELIPLIDKNYRTISDKSGRAVIGYSMGGFGAMVLPMKNPDLFAVSVPLSMSFRTDAQYMTESQNGWNEQWGKIFGAVGESGSARLTDYYKAHCPYYNFTPENAGTLSSVKWFLHCGDDEEQLLIANDSLHVLMRDNGFEHEYRVNDGGHTSSYWRASLNEVLPFVQSVLNGEEGWDWQNITPEIEEITLNEDGSFASEGYSDADSGKAIFIAHNNFDSDLLNDIISIIQRGVHVKPYVILPCNLAEEGMEYWIEFWEKEYKVGGDSQNRTVIAYGEAGADVYTRQEMFSNILFEDARLGVDEVVVKDGITYYIGQNDESVNYRDMGNLYKACKRSNADFEYRVRNYSGTHDEDILRATEVLKQYIRYQ